MRKFIVEFVTKNLIEGGFVDSSVVIENEDVTTAREAEQYVVDSLYDNDIMVNAIHAEEVKENVSA